MKAVVVAHDTFYVVLPRAMGVHAPTPKPLGPFASHRDAFLARAAWAYDAKDAPDRAEILTAEQVASDYPTEWSSVLVAAHPDKPTRKYLLLPGN
jgi:hypothetical protein